MKVRTVEKIFPALGTVNRLRIEGAYSDELLDMVKERVLQIHRRFSMYDGESDISRINKNAGIAPVKIHEETMTLLECSGEYRRRTGGAFDITAGAVSELWKQGIKMKTLPPAGEIRNWILGRRHRELLLDRERCTAFLTGRGEKLDMGGIAKGYAADEARKLIEAWGVKEAVINFGGTVAVMGRERVVGIQNPFQPTGTAMGTVLLKNKTVVTSGSYENAFSLGGKQYHHMIDPVTGYPADSELLSVTLVGDQGAQLDALATGIYIMGKDRGLELIGSSRMDAVFVFRDGSVRITPGLASQWTMIA